MGPVVLCFLGKANRQGGGRLVAYLTCTAVKLKLAYMGHKARPETGTFGGYQGIWREPNLSDDSQDPRRYFGASDPRKDGCAVGY